MTIVSRPVDGLTSAEISSIPFTAGWTSAAIAVHSMLTIPVPMFLRLEADEHPPILIDFRHRAFSWPVPMAEFPAHPIDVRVETEPTTADAAPLFVLPGRNLDSLLWEIGQHSFAGLPAPWLNADDRFKLTRWPNLIEHAHTLTQMRMTAMLGNVQLTVAELAVAADVDVTEAQSLVNALSLMGILQTADTAAVAPTVRPVAAQGLFDRLRRRLGI